MLYFCKYVLPSIRISFGIIIPFFALFGFNPATLCPDCRKSTICRLLSISISISFLSNCPSVALYAVPPIRIFKYLLLKSIYDLSDIALVERSKYDMSFKYFLDMAPEDEVINPSSLTKFRKLRLKDMNLLDMLIAKTVQLTLEKGIIKSKYIIMDATHTKSKYNQKTPPSSTPGTIKKTAP